MHNLAVNQSNGGYSYAGLEPAWHKLGTIMEPDQSLEDWIRAAGADFEIMQAPVQYATDFGTVQADDRYVLYRSDTGSALNVGVTGQYKIVQPAEVFFFFENLIREAGFTMETGGVLGNGATYWAMARINGDFDVAGDRHTQRALVATSSDSSKATSVKETMTRVVCQNTLSVALGGNGGIKVRHSREFDAEGIKRQLGWLSEHFQEDRDRFTSDLEMLAEVRMTPAEQARFLAQAVGDKPALQLIQDTASPSASEIIQAGNRKLRDLWVTHTTAPGQDTDAARGTLFGAVQAVTRHVDHEQGRQAEASFQASAWGAGDTLKSRTLNLAKSFAKAA